ncbi:MAG: SDR family oxidoreductase [Candidatus Helarchaeota archaeon]
MSENWIKGKICMITGANSGIGKETARELARMGAKVVMVCRNEQRGQAALAEIQEDTGSDQVELFLADLLSQESIRKMVSSYKQKYKKLHVLVNNAGLIFYKREVTPEGYEKTLAINHLGHFLLTNLLLDMIKASAPARIITVSSGAHKMAKLDLDDLMMKKKKRLRFFSMASYSNSKLANILFTYELARRLEGTNVTANVLHPGGVKTNFGKGTNPWYYRVMFSVASPFLKSPAKGAKTSIYLASSPDVQDITGKYFVNCQETKSSDISYDEDLQKKLWDISEKLTNLR